MVSVLGLWLAYRSYAADRQKYQAQAQKESSSPAASDAGCGFPVHFVQDTLYVLITRFEDFQNENGSECYGRGIERRIDQLVQSRKIPVVFCYCDDLSPNQSREADRLRDEFHADLIIWGKLRNAGPDCKADGFCLQFNPSDTLIRYVGGEVPTPDLDDFQRSIAASDIEQGLINMGAERFDDWFVGMFNLKIGKRKPELFVIEEAWNKQKKAEAYFARGEIWCHVGHYAEGAADYTNAVENGFISAKVYHGRGWAKINLKLLDDAVLDLDQAIRLDSNDMVAYCYRGLLKCMRNSYAKGISDYDHAIALAPNNYQAYSTRGLAKLSLGHHSEALADFDRSIAINPKYAYGYLGRGYANVDLGRYGLAVANFNRAEMLKPKLTADIDYAYYSRESIRINAGHYTQVIEDAKQAFKTYPKSPYPYLARGLANCKSGALSKAMIDCNQCIKIYPKCGEAYYVRGMIRRDLGQYAEAMYDFNQALSINKEHIRAYQERGRIKNKLGRYKEAIRDFDQAIAIDSKDASLFTSRGFAKDDLGQYANAVSDYDTAIALSPQYATAYDLRSYSKRRNGQYFSALSDYCYSIWLEPSRGWMWYIALLGVVYSWKSKIINPFLLRLLARVLPQKSVKTPPPHIKSPTTRRRKP